MADGMHQEASTGEISGTPAAAAPNTLHLKIYSPFQTYFDGVSESLTAANDTGPFDVLPGHKNFLTLLNPCDIIVREPGGHEGRFRITRGVMHVKANEVIVFLDV